MDAIRYLTDQHHEIRSLFDQFETAVRLKTKVRLCRKLVDLIAVHTALEEMIFFPAAQSAAAGALLPVAFDRHLAAERLIAEIVAAGGASRAAAVKMALLGERKRRHTDEEERALFPRVRALLTPLQLEAIGERMEGVADQLMEPGVGARERIGARRALA